MKTKILYTINFINNGGPSRVLLNQMKKMNKDKYDIYLLTIIDSNNQDIINSLRKQGIKVIEIRMKKKVFDVIKYNKEIINKINKLNPDIIHTHGIVTSIIVASNKIKTQKITTIHNNITEDYYFSYGKIKGKIIEKIHISRLKKFNHIICCSKTSYEIIRDKLNNATYIRNGIDIENIDNKEKTRRLIRRQLNIPMNARVYIYCGVITNRKRVYELVNLFNNSLEENEYLIIVGDGKDYEKIKENIKNSNIKMVGYKKNVIDYYQASDIYTSCSSSEGFSISIIEALSCNLLLLISDIPSHRECFEIDKNIYIGEYFKISEFKEKKSKIMKKNTSETSKFYETYLSANSMSEKYEEYYKISGGISEKN